MNKKRGPDPTPVPDDFAEQFAALPALARRLNADADLVARAVNAAEVFLGGMGLDLYGEALYESNVVAVDPVGGRYRTTLSERYLAYGPAPGPYRILVVEKVATGWGDGVGTDEWHAATVNRTVWSSCPRDIKLESAKAVPDLIGALAAKATRLLDGTAEALAVVRGLFDRLAPGDDPGGGDAVTQFILVTFSYLCMTAVVACYLLARWADRERRTLVWLLANAGVALWAVLLVLSVWLGGVYFTVRNRASAFRPITGQGVHAYPPGPAAKAGPHDDRP
jgi:hypothetical protein